MRKSCCERNDSNPVHARWCWCVQCTNRRWVHWTNINISASALDLNHFSSIKTYACIDLIHTRACVNTFILRLIHQLNDLKQMYLTVNNTLFTHEKVSETIIAPGRGMFLPMNQSEQALTKDKLFMFRAISHLLLQNFVGIVRWRYVDKIIHFYSHFLHFTTF